MNIDVKKAKKLMDDFHSQVVPWCEECQLSLHNAFEISRSGTTNDDTMRYRILSELWQTKFGNGPMSILWTQKVELFLSA